jgi:hypothetical protein
MNAFATITSVSRVLAMPELLAMIFNGLEHHDNFNNAIVCRRWSETALNALWHTVDDVIHLFRMLAPLDIVITESPGTVARSVYVRTSDIFMFVLV